MTNNTPQPVYGMNQPMAPYSQPMLINQPIPMNQPYAPGFQPSMGDPMQPFNGGLMNEASYGLGMQAQQQGPIIY